VSRGWARIGELGPAWIGAIATLIVALTGAGFFAGRVTAPTVTPTQTVTVTPTETPGPDHSEVPSPTGTSSIYWTGSVGFTGTSGLGLDFDTRPPSTDQTTIIYEGNELSATANAQLSLWTQSSTPSASQCQSWVTTHPNTAIPSPASGMQMCIKTDQGRYGFLHIDSSSNDQLQVTATIWKS
jgi:hypothetical protein